MKKFIYTILILLFLFAAKAALSADMQEQVFALSLGAENGGNAANESVGSVAENGGNAAKKSADLGRESGEVSSILGEYAAIYGKEITSAIEDAAADGSVEKIMPDFDAEELLSGLMRGENIFSAWGVVKKGAELLAGEIKNTMRLAVFILILGLLSSYLTVVCENLGEGAANSAFFLCYMLAAGVSAAALMEIISCTSSAISNISAFMRIIVPVALASLAASGAVISASALGGLLISIIEITQWIMETFLMPLLLMSAAISLVNNMSQQLKVEKLTEAINKTVKWCLALMLTLFVGICSLQSIAASGADALTVRVTKFAASSLIPVVGGILSESVETVMNCSSVIKNSVGVVGVIAVVMICAVPLIKISACLIVLRLCAALLQPVSHKSVVSCVSSAADAAACMLSIVAASCVMFVILLTVIINISA